MGRHKGTKNKVVKAVEQVEVVKPVEHPIVPQETISEPVKKKVVKKDEFVLAKTTDREIVVAVNKLGFEIVHVSGAGSVHNPKVFFIKVNLDKLCEVVEDEKMNNVEPADYKEIVDRINASRVQGIKEYEASGAKKRKLNAEIVPSEFIDA
jgi:hypothetical protein